MTQYIARRSLAGFISITVASFCIFSLLHLLPGNPAFMILGGRETTPTAEQVEIVTRRLGLDKPVLRQYGMWLGRIVKLDLGDSYIQNLRLSDEIPKRLWRSLQLTIPALIVGTAIGVALGVLAAYRHGELVDVGANVLSLLAYSTPVFVVGAGLMVVFAINLGWLPTSGYVGIEAGLISFLKGRILPWMTLTVAPIAIGFRMTRSCVLETLYADHVRTARSKGVRERSVLWRHALRSALPPIVTTFGMQAGAMFGGSVLVESLFNWPGMGIYMLQAANTHDYPAIQAMALVIAVLFVATNLVVDVVCGLIDPRISYS